MQRCSRASEGFLWCTVHHRLLWPTSPILLVKTFEDVTSSPWALAFSNAKGGSSLSLEFCFVSPYFLNIIGGSQAVVRNDAAMPDTLHSVSPSCNILHSSSTMSQPGNGSGPVHWAHSPGCVCVFFVGGFSCRLGVFKWLTSIYPVLGPQTLFFFNYSWYSILYYFNVYNIVVRHLYNLWMNESSW